VLARAREIAVVRVVGQELNILDVDADQAAVELISLIGFARLIDVVRIVMVVFLLLAHCHTSDFSVYVHRDNPAHSGTEALV
jgi:hypothetical protein